MTALRLACLLALVACSSPPTDPGTGPLNPSIVGSYTLRTIDAMPLPFVTPSVSLVGGRVELHADSTFLDILILKFATGEVYPDSLSGTYRLAGDSVVFRDISQKHYVMGIKGSTLSAVWYGHPFVYSR